MRGKFLVLIALLAVVLCVQAQKAEAQYFGGYGAGFNPSPQALYGPGGANTGVLHPNGYVQGYGYAPPPPMYNNGYDGMGYGGGYGQQRMSVPEALIFAYVMTNQNRNYGYQPRYNSGHGRRGGYGDVGHHRHHHHHR